MAHQSSLSYALLLIKIRLRSEFELRQKMGQKKYLPKEIDETIGKLKKAGLIDDRFFAEQWLKSQLRYKADGKQILLYKIKKFGLDPEIVSVVYEKLEMEFSEEDRVCRIIESKMSHFARLSGYEKRQKMLAYPLRKGFSYDISLKAIDNGSGESK
jgi:regulatory protein